MVVDGLERATREGYSEALLELGETRDDVVVLDCDLSKSTGAHRFADRFPERFINCGIAEQSMMGAAAGLAAEGKICFTGSFAIFAVGRAFEQVRNAIAYCQLGVKICPSHAGVTVGPDGGSHQSVEDLALMRSVPNIKVVVPADFHEAKAVVKASVDIPGPMYIRLGRLKVPSVFASDYRYEVGKARKLRTGSDLSIFSTGTMTAQALEAADALAEQGVEVDVVHVSTLKPMDEESVVASARKTGAVVTAEEHSVIGGLGGAVAEVLGRLQPTRMAMVGIDDRFGVSGDPDDLCRYFSITGEDIVAAGKRLCRD